MIFVSDVNPIIEQTCEEGLTRNDQPKFKLRMIFKRYEFGYENSYIYHFVQAITEKGLDETNIQSDLMNFVREMDCENKFIKGMVKTL